MFLRFFVVGLVLCVAAFGADSWSLEDPDKGWNQDELTVLYYRHSELQRQWACSTLARADFQPTDRVLDVGCGDGKISAQISYSVPQGEVVGVDMAPAMVDFATKMFPYPNVSFKRIDNGSFEGFGADGSFDWVVSFCVFHVVNDPQTTLTNLHAHLRTGGRLLLTYPVGAYPTFYQAARETMAAYGINAMKPASKTRSFRDPEQAPAILEAAGFEVLEFEVVDSQAAYYSKEDLVRWFEGTLSGNWSIPPEIRRDFMSDLVDRYLELEPSARGNDGIVYFRLACVEVLAQKG